MAAEKKMDVVILGLLQGEAMTGYEIKKKLDSRLRYFWNGSFGSIYPTLEQLEASGCIQAISSEQGGRGRIRYAVTDTGTERLKAWLEDANAKDELRYETLLKLSFGNVAGRETAVKQIRHFAEKKKRDLVLLHSLERSLEQEEGEERLYFLLTVRFGAETARGQLRWCEDAERLLREKTKKSDGKKKGKGKKKEEQSIVKNRKKV